DDVDSKAEPVRHWLQGSEIFVRFASIRNSQRNTAAIFRIFGLHTNCRIKTLCNTIPHLIVREASSISSASTPGTGCALRFNQKSSPALRVLGDDVYAVLSC